MSVALLVESLRGQDQSDDDAPGPSHEQRTDLEAIASILLEEVGKITTLRKGKGREDEPPADNDMAFDLFAEELKALLSVIETENFARSLVTAVETDHDLIEELAQIDNRILEDQSCAARVGRGENLTPPPSHSPRGAPSIVRTKDDADISTRASSVPNSPSPAEPSSLPKLNSELSPLEALECTACGDPGRKSDLLFPCSHTYHIRCAVQLFESSITDESLWPPRCCRQPIPTELVAPHLSRHSAARLAEVGRERATADRLYCPIPTCSYFIGPASREQAVVTCIKCTTKICTMCKEVAHEAHIPCRTDTAAQEVIALAQDKGWQRCPRCHQMIELEHGCHHMTCLCRTEFCYLCQALWKTCPCDQWDEPRLLIAAEHQVNNRFDGNRVVMEGPRRERLIFQAAEGLRRDHECMHPSWRYRHGAAQCENCRNYLPRYILCCNQCEMRACVRCQRNRL